MDKKTAERRKRRYRGESGAILTEMVMKISLIAIVAMPGVASVGFEVADLMCDNAVHVVESGHEAEIFGHFDPTSRACQTCQDSGFPLGLQCV